VSPWGRRDRARQAGRVLTIVLRISRDQRDENRNGHLPGPDGQKLAARLDSPDDPARAYALFAHCFTCGKDVFAASRIAQRLSEHGIAVFRFDFTGLGASEGEFANTKLFVQRRRLDRGR